MERLDVTKPVSSHWDSFTFGVDFFDTYADVARLTSFRIIYVLFVMLQFIIDNMDVDVAFLNATL